MTAHSRRARWMLLGGAVLLGLMAAIHLLPAYSGVRRAVAAGRVTEAPDLPSGILQAAWVVVGSDLALLAVLVVTQLLSGRPNRTVMLIAGLIPLLGGLIIAYFIAEIHFAVFLLLGAALLLLGGALQLPRPE